MNALSIALVITLGLSLAHPNGFGVAWTLVGLACFVLALKHRRTADRQENAWKIWLLAFGPLTALSILSAVIFNLSLSRAEVIEVFFGGLLFCLGLRHFRPSPAVLRHGLMLAAALGAVLAGYEFFVLSHPRVGMVFHPINFALACGATLLVLGLLWAFSATSADKTVTTAVAIFAAAVTLIGSGSRGPILAVLLCFSAAWFMGRGEKNASNRLRISGFALFLIATFIAMSIAVFAIRFGTDLQLGADSSIGKRWQLIEISVTQILKTPWFGVGTDQAGKFFSGFAPPISSLDHAHVTLLNLGLELGIPGLIGWVWAFSVLGWAFLRPGAHYNSAISRIGLLVCGYIFLCALTQDLLSHAYTRKYLALLLGLLLVMRVQDSKHDNKNVHV